MRRLLRYACLTGLLLLLTGCANTDFGGGTVAALLSNGPKQLDGEQVVVTKEQIKCGERDDLWVVEGRGEDRSIGRLLQKGRDLGFGDDVQIGEYRYAYVMVRGKLALQSMEVVNIHEEDPTTKIAEVKVGVVIKNACFDRPLPLMGVRKGQFDPDTPARFEFAMNDTWQYERILH